MRIPRNLLNANLIDFGSYYECLEINEESSQFTIEGKYCLISIPLKQNVTLLNSLAVFNPSEFEMVTYPLQKIGNRLELLNKVKQAMIQFSEGINSMLSPWPELPDEVMSLRLAVCVPKPCTTRQYMKQVSDKADQLGITYREDFCRLSDDKPWETVDYVTVSILMALLVLTLFSSSYDIYMQVIKKDDPAKTSEFCRSFSVYTNTRRLLRTESKATTLKCVDGIRTLAMCWVVIGHVLSLNLRTAQANPLHFAEWLTKPSSIILSAAPITVDTFFVLSGLFVVYATAGKFTGVQLIKNLHRFYLHRLLRIYPLLVFIILLQISIWPRVADGPNWNRMMANRNYCINNWWTNLLFIQNFRGTNKMCVPHTWYVAVDIQLYILSPLLLFWVLNNKRRTAWIALVGSLLGFFSIVTGFAYIIELHSMPLSPSRINQLRTFLDQYYYSPLVRVPQYIIGMITGYILHLYRGKQWKIPTILVTIFWTCAIIYVSSYLYSVNVVMQKKFDNQALDNALNAFSKPLWALMVSWLILACVFGYGGPVNWFLSLVIWKIPARLSYAVYMFHYSFIDMLAFSALEPIYFSNINVIRDTIFAFIISAALAAIAMVVIEYPFSTLIDLAFGRALVSKKKNEPINSADYGMDDINNTEIYNHENKIS